MVWVSDALHQFEALPTATVCVYSHVAHCNTFLDVGWAFGCVLLGGGCVAFDDAVLEHR